MIFVVREDEESDEESEASSEDTPDRGEETREAPRGRGRAKAVPLTEWQSQSGGFEEIIERSSSSIGCYQKRPANSDKLPILHWSGQVDVILLGVEIRLLREISEVRERPHGEEEIRNRTIN